MIRLEPINSTTNIRISFSGKFDFSLVARLVLFDIIDLMIDVEVGPLSGIKALIELKPITFGEFFRLTKGENDDGGPTLDLAIKPLQNQFHLYLNCFV